jgi:hypothetical protein
MLVEEYISCLLLFDTVSISVADPDPRTRDLFNRGIHDKNHPGSYFIQRA